MNCKVSRHSVLNGFCTALNSAFIEIKFRQIFYIKFCIKYNWSFEDFLKIHITFYKHISNTNKWGNVKENYLSIEPLPNLLAAFFVEKTRFLLIFFWKEEQHAVVFRGNNIAW